MTKEFEMFSCQGVTCLGITIYKDTDSQRSSVLILLKLNVCNSIRKCKRKFTRVFMLFS